MLPVCGISDTMLSLSLSLTSPFTRFYACVFSSSLLCFFCVIIIFIMKCHLVPQKRFLVIRRAYVLQGELLQGELHRAVFFCHFTTCQTCYTCYVFVGSSFFAFGFHVFAVLLKVYFITLHHLTIISQYLFQSLSNN